MNLINISSQYKCNKHLFFSDTTQAQQNQMKENLNSRFITLVQNEDLSIPESYKQIVDENLYVFSAQIVVSYNG